jgi:hypothetical protein
VRRRSGPPDRGAALRQVKKIVVNGGISGTVYLFRSVSRGPRMRWCSGSSVMGASPDAPASRVHSGRWSGQDCIPTQSMGTRYEATTP